MNESAQNTEYLYTDSYITRAVLQTKSAFLFIIIENINTRVIFRVIMRFYTDSIYSFKTRFDTSGELRQCLID